MTAPPEPTVEQVLTTTRSVRLRLELGRPVDRAVIDDCLRIALQAPNGANRQDWRFLVIDDPELKSAVAKYYRAAFEDRLRKRPETGQRALRSASHLAEHLHEVPALVLACMRGRCDGVTTARQSAYYGSVYPALWSFMLAARARGLGTCLTTAHLALEREVADLVGLPFEQVGQVALIAVGHLRGTGFRPAPRAPIEQVRFYNSWPAEGAS